MANRGLKRLLIFVVFLIPVGWYLFLQIFGENRFSLSILAELSQECGPVEGISVLCISDSLTLSQANYINRVTYQTTIKDIPFLSNQTAFFECAEIENDLMLVNKEGIWGVYNLDREGVDRLLTELDILIMQKSYGKGVSR